MKIVNLGSKLNNQVKLNLSDEELEFVQRMSNQYHIKQGQYIRILIDWFMNHIEEFNLDN